MCRTAPITNTQNVDNTGIETTWSDPSILCFKLNFLKFLSWNIFNICILLERIWIYIFRKVYFFISQTAHSNIINTQIKKKNIISAPTWPLHIHFRHMLFLLTRILVKWHLGPYLSCLLLYPPHVKNWQQILHKY